MFGRDELLHVRARGQRRVSVSKSYVAAALLALLVIALGGHLEVAIARANQGPTPVFSVSQIRADLARYPKYWVGRTVRVRGILQGPFTFCGATRPCPPSLWGLIDAENESVTPDRLLPVVAGAPAPLWAALRHLPMVATLEPAPQLLRFGLPTIYRLQLRAAPTLCAGDTRLPCAEGVLVDAVWPVS
jgi:hypothetical protein